MMRKILTLIYFTIISFGITAQQPLTLNEVLSKVLENNYSIKLVKTELEAYQINQQYIIGAFLPQLSGTATRIWNVNSQKQEFSDGTKRERDDVKSSNISSAINLNWTLFDGTKMFATKEKIEEFVTLGELVVKEEMVNTVSEAIRLYYNIVQAKQQITAIEEQISINEERVKLADRKLSVGLGSKPELLQASVDLNAQKAAILRQETDVAQLKEQLNQLMGEPLNFNFEVPEDIPLNLELSFDELLNSIDSSPALEINKKNIELSKLTVRERKAERWPTINFVTAYNFSRTNNAVVVNPFQPLFSLNKGFNYGLTASVPLLSNFNIRRQIKQAELEVKRQELIFENEQSFIQTEILNAYKDYQYQIQALKLEEENIGLARENVTIALERFRQGVSTYLELREAQISLSESNTRLIAARYNTKLAETRLLQLSGKVIENP